MDSEAETVMQLRNELRDKEMKLTDIRLEALSSAHQLDQLREAMNRMQVRAGDATEPQAAGDELFPPRSRPPRRTAFCTSGLGPSPKAQPDASSSAKPFRVLQLGVLLVRCPLLSPCRVVLSPAPLTF